MNRFIPNLHLNLRLKVLLFTIAIILILLIISHIITSTLVSAQLEEQLTKRTLSALSNVNAWLSDRKDKLFDLARLSAGSRDLIISASNEDPIALRNLLRNDDTFVGGDAFLVENTRSDWEFEIAQRPYDPDARLPRKANQFEDAAFSMHGQIEFFRSDNNIVLAVTVPILAEDGEIGLLSIGEEIGPDSLEDLMILSGSDHLHILVDTSFSASTLEAGEQEQLLADLPDTLQAGEVYKATVDNLEYLTMTSALPDSSDTTIGHILVQFSTRENQQIISNISNALNLSALGAFIVFSLVSVYFTGRVTDNLNSLVEHVGALGEGRYGEKITIDSHDEVGMLAGAFDDLRIKLRDRTNALVEANRDLDQRVQEISGLNNVMVAIASNLPLDRVMDIIAREAARQIPMDLAWLALKERQGEGRMRLLAGHGDTGGPDYAIPLTEGNNLAEKLNQQSGPHIEKLDQNSRLSDVAWMAKHGLRSACYIPMQSEDAFIGVICLATTRDNLQISGQVSGFLEKLATEVTVALQRLRLNEELQLIEGRFSRMVESVRDGIFQTDASGNILFFNDAARRMFKLEPEDELADVSLQDLLVHKKDMTRLLSELEEKGYVSSFSVHMSGPKGGRFEAELTVNYTDDEVGKRGIEGIVRDVTVRKKLERELQRSEAFMRQVIEGTTNSIFTLNEQAEISFTNHQLVELSGFDEDSLLGMKISDLFVPEAQAEFNSRLQEVLRQRKPLVSLEVQLLRADHSLVSGLLSLAPLEGESSDQVAVGALADITEIKKLEDQLIRSERLASMGQIAASVAHEINNPLGIILGFTQDMIGDREDSDPDMEALRTIETETSRCARIVKDLLDLARADTVRRRPVDLATVIEKTLPLFKLHFRDGDIRLEKQFADVPPVLGDEHQLQQILMNVIINAVHAMESSGGTLKIDLSAYCPVEGGDAEARVVISDTGIGIRQEHLDRIFDPFFSTKRSGGSGLGLFIVHRLVEAHGGTVTVESQPDIGTAFIITLPTTKGN